MVKNTTSAPIGSGGTNGPSSPFPPFAGTPFPAAGFFVAGAALDADGFGAEGLEERADFLGGSEGYLILR